MWNKYFNGLLVENKINEEKKKNYIMAFLELKKTEIIKLFERTS